MTPAPAPGLGPAVADHRSTPRAAVGTFVLVTVGMLAFSVLLNWRDGRSLLPDGGDGVIALVGGGFLGLFTLFSAVTAGPGWLISRRIKGSSWVRTDQLVRVRAGQGFADVNLRLRDRDGREMFIPWSAVTASPKLAARFCKDVAVSAAAGADLDKRSVQILLGRRR